MVRDRGRVARPRVPAAAQAGLLRRRRQGAKSIDPECAQGGEQLAAEASEGPWPLEQCERVIDVALDVEVADDVGAGEAELTRRRRNSTKRV